MPTCDSRLLIRVLSIAALSLAVCWTPLLGAAQPKHTVIFIIDGLSYKAVDRLPLENLQELIGRGVYYEKSYNVMPAHPKTGSWAKYHSCSIPNPVILAGTALLRPDQKYVQQSFYPKKITAHVASSSAYRTLNAGFHLSFMVSAGVGGTDSKAVDWALKYMKGWKPAYMRIHLQQTGSAGSLSYSETDASKPWYRNIWAEDSPYRETAVEADRQLGRFLEGLREMGLEEETLLFVTSDHGEADTGWHPPEEETGWAMPLVVAGPGVRKGKRFPYAEQIDIVPTLCHLMGVTPPENADGRILAEALTDPPAKAAPRKQRIRELNLVLLEGQRALARSPKARKEFLGVERILEWHEHGTLEQVIEHNRKIVEAHGKE